MAPSLVNVSVKVPARGLKVIYISEYRQLRGAVEDLLAQYPDRLLPIFQHRLFLVDPTGNSQPPQVGWWVCHVGCLTLLHQVQYGSVDKVTGNRQSYRIYIDAMGFVSDLVR